MKKIILTAALAFGFAGIGGTASTSAALISDDTTVEPNKIVCIFPCYKEL